MSITSIKLAPFLKQLHQIEEDYKGVFQGNDSDIVALEEVSRVEESIFEANVQQDVGKLYNLALDAIRNDAEGEDVQTLLRGLDKTDDLLLLAKLSREQVSPHHQLVREYLEDSLENDLMVVSDDDYAPAPEF